MAIFMDIYRPISPYTSIILLYYITIYYITIYYITIYYITIYYIYILYLYIILYILYGMGLLYSIVIYYS